VFPELTDATEDAAEQAVVPSRSYKLVSATYADKAYSAGSMSLDETRSEIELWQSAGKRKRDEQVMARFRVEPNAEVKVDGPLLKVSELSITLESPEEAAKVADLLGRPVKEREEVTLLKQAESSVVDFLEAREEAMDLLTRMKADPRAAMVSAESLWTNTDSEPLEAVYFAYSARLAESLEKMTTFLAEAEKKLGSGVIERLYALGYTMGAVQNSLFDGDSTLAQEIAALQELGVATTAQDLQLENPTERLMLRAHPALEALASSK
jgi:hypothetical protein